VHQWVWQVHVRFILKLTHLKKKKEKGKKKKEKIGI